MSLLGGGRNQDADVLKIFCNIIQKTTGKPKFSVFVSLRYSLFLFGFQSPVCDFLCVVLYISSTGHCLEE